MNAATVNRPASQAGGVVSFLLRDLQKFDLKIESS